MADIPVVPGSVVPTLGDAPFLHPFVAPIGEAASRGDIVYLRSSDKKYCLARSNGTAEQANASGMIGSEGGISQQVTIIPIQNSAQYFTGIFNTVVLGVNLPVGIPLFLSNTPGKMCFLEDLPPGSYLTEIGSTRDETTVVLNAIISGVQISYRNLPYNVLAGNPPNAYERDFAGDSVRVWAESILIPKLEANIPNERATTYYFSNSMGDDTTGDGSEDDPWKTVAKANTVIAASTGDIRCRFKRGDVWRENSALTIGKDLVTVDDYDSGSRPIITNFTMVYDAGGWTPLGGSVYSRSEATTIGWVRLHFEEDGAQFGVLKREDTQAHCAAFPGSWAQVAGTLYINTNGLNPNGIFYYEACPQTGDKIVTVTGDNVRLQNLNFHGGGIDHTTPTYALYWNHNGNANPNLEGIAVDCDFVYTGYHSLGHIAKPGDRMTFIRCRGGYCKKPTGASTTTFVSYAPAGGQELICLDCAVLGGTLPGYEWSATATSQDGAGIFQHTSGAPTPAFSIAIRTKYPNNQYQVAGGTAIYAAVSVNDLISECRAYVIGENAETNIPPSLGMGAKDRCHINCIQNYEYNIPDHTNTVIVNNNDDGRGWSFNCTMKVHFFGAGLPGLVVWYDNGSSPFGAILENCRIELTGINNLAATSLVSNNFGTRARLRNCVISVQGNNVTGDFRLNTSAAAVPNGTFQNCAYATPNVQTIPAINDSGAVVYPYGSTIPNTRPAPWERRFGRGMVNGLEYDQTDVFRDPVRRDIGVFVGDLSIPAPSYYTGWLSFWALDEVTGTGLRVDGIGGNPLTTHNSVGQQAGTVGYASELTGTQWFSHASNADVQVGDQIRFFTGWIRLASKASSQVIVAKHDGATNAGSDYLLWYNVTPDRFELSVYQGGSAVTKTDAILGSPAVATWIFVEMWMRANVEIGIRFNRSNSANTQAITGNINAGSADFAMGATATGGAPADARFDNWTMHNRMLTAVELDLLYAAGVGHNPLT